MTDGCVGPCAWVPCGVALAVMLGGPQQQQHVPAPRLPMPAPVGQTQEGGEEINVKNERVALRGLH